MLFALVPPLALGIFGRIVDPPHWSAFGWPSDGLWPLGVLVGLLVDVVLTVGIIVGRWML